MGKPGEKEAPPTEPPARRDGGGGGGAGGDGAAKDERSFEEIGLDPPEWMEPHISRLKSMFAQNRKLYRENEETISSLMSQIKSMFGELKSEHEKDSQSFVELLQQSFGCESSFRNANVKFHELCEKLCEDKASHQQALSQAFDDIVSKFEEAKDRVIMQYDQISKKEKSMISALAGKVAKLDKSLKIEEEIEQEFKTLMRTICLYM